MLENLSVTSMDAIAACGAALLAAAALHDVAARTVPNRLSALILVAGCLARILDAHMLAGLGAGLVVFALSALCWRRGWMGGGDVKLLAATAVLVPSAAAVSLVLDVALAGGVLALIYLGLRVVVPAPASSARRPGSLIARVLRAERWRIHRNCPLPYASAIAAGALVCLIKG